jgi:predicted metal-dependent hydrolase
MAALELAYRVRLSQRARHVRLVLSDDGELTVVLPLGVPRAVAAQTVAEHQAWLERALRRIGAGGLEEALGRPEHLELRATGERYGVLYRPGAARCRAVVRDASIVVLTPKDTDAEVRQTLDRWLRRRALAAFEPRVRALAADLGVTVSRVSVRSPRTRWASCSASGAIMLSAQLLFLPASLVDHVICHELCHRTELNHSPAFWRLLEARSPGARAAGAQLRDAKAFVPRFLRTRRADLA